MNKILSALAIMLLGVSMIVQADTGNAPATQLKIGVIDLQRVIAQTPDAKRSSKELQARFEPRKTKIMAAQKALQADVEKLKRDEAILAQTEKSRLQENIMSQQRDLERMQQDFQQDVTLAQRTETDKFLNKVKQVIDSIAAKEHYDIVLQKNAIPFASDRIDITKQVIDGLA